MTFRIKLLSTVSTVFLLHSFSNFAFSSEPQEVPKKVSALRAAARGAGKAEITAATQASSSGATSTKAKARPCPKTLSREQIDIIFNPQNHPEQRVVFEAKTNVTKVRLDDVQVEGKPVTLYCSHKSAMKEGPIREMLNNTTETSKFIATFVNYMEKNRDDANTLAATVAKKSVLAYFQIYIDDTKPTEQTYSIAEPGYFTLALAANPADLPDVEETTAPTAASASTRPGDITVIGEEDTKSPSESTKGKKKIFLLQDHHPL